MKVMCVPILMQCFIPNDAVIVRLHRMHELNGTILDASWGFGPKEPTRLKDIVGVSYIKMIAIELSAEVCALELSNGSCFKAVTDGLTQKENVQKCVTFRGSTR